MKIELETGEHWIDERGFLCSNYVSDSPTKKLDVEHAQKHIEAIVKLCDGKPRLFFNDVRNVQQMQMLTIKASRCFAQSPELKKLRVAEAFVVKALNVRLMINLYIKVHKPECPSKVFSNEQDAIEWLLEYDQSDKEIE